MLKKLPSVVGIVACLLAAEGLNRFGGLVSAFGGADTPFYMGMLVVSLICAVFFVLALVGKLSKIAKWLGAIGLLGSAALMLAAPNFPVNQQILFSLFVAFLCMLTAATQNKVAATTTPK
jgi:hypothetical protein